MLNGGVRAKSGGCVGDLAARRGTQIPSLELGVGGGKDKQGKETE